MKLKKIIALYLRISKKDKKKEDLESNSIKNQRSILREYIKDYMPQTDFEIREFIDDGFSGTSMNRPAIQKLLDLVKSGMIYTILVKDLSRFSRNYIDIGNYIERIFPYINVRFISINDNYDSERVIDNLPEIDMAFKSIIYDYYCKELSIKMKLAHRQQIEKGRCIMAKPPYGYWKSKEKKGVLIIDENTAPIVKSIFEKYTQGMSAYKIAKYLNQKGVDSPNKRLEKAGLIKFNKNDSKNLCWTSKMVLSILKNQIYIGNMVGNKSERIKIGANRCRKLEKKEWIIVSNTHQPIIEKEIFDLANRLLIKNK